MTRTINGITPLILTTFMGLSTGDAAEARRLPLAEYRDKMTAGWVGQMVGVGWGAPTEFRFNGRIIPADKMPPWKPDDVNQFQQDDIYVEMTFLRTLEQHGWDASIRQAGIDFANSRYRLWHANRAGRDNLRRGIAPPDSGHPKFNKHADDIDYQIEADFAGLIAPGLPNTVIRLGETFGRLMNYGDGLYGGQFVGGMYAEAFFETDPVKIVRAGLACIPPKSQYAEAVRDVLRWHAENPTDWQATWNRIDAKYQRDPNYRRFSCSGPEADFNIDAKINGAYIVMGLLYGRRDPDKTIVIATRCGLDSDCNPSNAAGVLFATMGLSTLPKRFTEKLDRTTKFSYTAYDVDALVAVCEKLARQAVVRAGGRIVTEPDAGEVFVIPRQQPKPGPLEQCWSPGPIAGSRFTDAERAKITAKPGLDLSEAIQRVAPGWNVRDCGDDMDPGLRATWRGRKNVLVTHPLNRDRGCTLYRTMTVPDGRSSELLLDVSHHPQGDWQLVVKADGRDLTRRTVGAATTHNGWLNVRVDLSAYAGKEVMLEVINQPTGWAWEAGYWASIRFRHRP